ncbi:MAG: Ni/Fe hydrogenase subunit alpha [Burkholderiaceae bacterium]|nr:Ni/Fe hydrogenase subunit alpha [Burkholderiaceae bacterium]
MDPAVNPATLAAAGLRRVAIDPVSRVEGHGKVTLLLDEAGHVRQARLHIVEFRGFERFIVGRPYWEVPVMVQRLCGICPVSHHLAASKAIDVALGVADAVPPSAQALRRLMHHGQILQSHALHFFHLASPDLLFGFDSERDRRSIMAVAEAHPEIARQGVLLRKFGQEVIRLTAGKRVHGTGSVPGGVNRQLTPEERDALAAGLPQVIDWCERAVDLVDALHARQPALYEGFGAMRSSWLSLVGDGRTPGVPAGAMDLYDGALRWRDADGALLLDGVDVQRYADHIEEAVEPWTYMKFPYLRSLGRERGWYRVGPLARVQNVDAIPTARAEARRQAFVAGGMVHGTLAYHAARMIEMLHAAEVIGALLAGDEVVQGERVAPLPGAQAQRREGVGVIEAPRGTLIHRYAIGADDLVTECDLIVSTTHNNEAMNEAVRSVAREHLDGRELTEPLLSRIEIAVRAYDPCLSCATHALGRMPLELSLLDAGGDLLDVLRRDADGRVGRELA